MHIATSKMAAILDSKNVGLGHLYINYSQKYDKY